MKSKVIILLLSLTLSLTAQTEGILLIEKSVIGSGGNRSSGGAYSLESTTGQAAAGGIGNGSPYSAYTGFWTHDLAPTAAGVSVRGRVTTAGGDGIGHARVVLMGADGSSRSSLTNIFGYFSLADVEVGHTYLVTVESRRYQFDSQVVTVNDELTDLNFVALP